MAQMNKYIGCECINDDHTNDEKINKKVNINQVTVV
jgi:hypothetical protein